MKKKKPQITQITQIFLLFSLGVPHDDAPHPETDENSATKTQRHIRFIYNNLFCATLCPGGFVQIYTRYMDCVKNPTVLALSACFGGFGFRNQIGFRFPGDF